ncbi:hypothetical protein OPT61_g2123 [Boeremia exigua]|uniref:Uncharacterized protein n=1 Tax=Boeremia exigua TaxID=749465 RepID=A0ACC2IMN2_9PLEO|nr:hypothetical protein OPT61_g2123 [Boeremia exigua]
MRHLFGSCLAARARRKPGDKLAWGRRSPSQRKCGLTLGFGWLCGEDKDGIESRVRRRALQQLLALPKKGRTQCSANGARPELHRRGCKTIAAALETPAISPRLSGVQFSQPPEACPGASRRASAAAIQRSAVPVRTSPQHVHAVGLAAAPQVGLRCCSRR